MPSLPVFLLAVGLWSLTAGPTHQATAAEAIKSPNIVVIVSDNQGWMDIGYHGSKIRTPHLDRLARDGVRLNRHYVFPMCSPTRAGFVSGRNPSRYGILGAIGWRSKQALPPETFTIADALKRQGYETAITGKWHLGLRPEVGPLQYGFDSSYGHFHGQIDKYTHRYKNGDKSWHRNDRLIDEEGHATDLTEAAAIEFIERRRNRPFFLYVPFTAPLTPLQEEAKWVRPYDGVFAEQSRREYAASITHMDAAVGNVVAALERTGQRERTLIVFFSDNGAVPRLGPSTNYQGKFGPYDLLGDNGRLRGWIGELYDGSLRTPALVNWPGVLKPRLVESVVSVLDWYPTLAGRAGYRPEATLALEGEDIWELLTGQADQHRDRELYWKTGNGVALRQADWKLVLMPRKKSVELFEMNQDPFEEQNLADEFPDQVARLRELLRQQAVRDP